MTKRWAWALVALAGCSFESATSTEPVENRCAIEGDCQEGACDGNLCIDDSGASVEVAIEVVRSASDSQVAAPLSWAFGPELRTGPSVRDLVLPATREVRGVVRWDGLRVPATLRFVRRMPVSVEPLQPVPVQVEALRQPSGEGFEAFDFTTVLVAGETYDVVVQPTGDVVVSPLNSSAPAIRSLPPLYREVTIDGGAPDEPFRFDVSFPSTLTSDCTDVIDTGCTLEADVITFDGEVEAAEAGLQVRAIDKATGRVVSSIAETDPTGHFAIRIGDDASDYLIRVTSSVGRDPFPAVSVDPDVAFEGNAFKKVIYIPRVDPVQFTGRVRDGDGSAVPGAALRFITSSVFEGSQLGLQGSFSNSATTDEEGRFGVQLLPGFYAITVTPPEDEQSTWGILASEALVGEGTSDADALVVPSKVELLGWVGTFNDEAAVGVTIGARARTSVNPESQHRSQEAVTNSLGGFTMRMDRGTYDIHVKVPSENGYAWLVEPELLMEGDLSRTYRLPPPIPIQGVVSGSEGTPVPDAIVRAYVLTGDTVSGRPVQVAETVADDEGNYRLLIAPSFFGE